MFFVLLVHCDFYSLGVPKELDIQTYPLSSFSRFMVEAFAIVCVNVFVLISGWFGIKPSLKGFANFIFQCFFFLFFIYLILMLCGVSKYSKTGLLNCFLFMENWWFVKAYIGLYILSPILNTFIENSGKKQLQIVLVSFFVFQSLYGWIIPSVNFICDGYSTFSFIGLYLLARYIKLYPNTLMRLQIKQDLLIYALLSVTIALVAFFRASHSSTIVERLYSYASPFVILSSLYLFIAFSKLRIQNNFVNKIASSAFAVYLLHTHFAVFDPIFKESIIYLGNSYASVQFGMIAFIILIAIFIVAVLLDQLRMMAYKYLNQFMQKATHKANRFIP